MDNLYLQALSVSEEPDTSSDTDSTGYQLVPDPDSEYGALQTNILSVCSHGRQLPGFPADTFSEAEAGPHEMDRNGSSGRAFLYPVSVPMVD